MWRWAVGGTLAIVGLAVGFAYLNLRDPSIDTSVRGDASTAELHEALSPCPRTYDRWPLGGSIVDRSAPSVTADSWWRVESIGEVIDRQDNGVETFEMDAVLVNAGSDDGPVRAEAMDAFGDVQTYARWGLREAEAMYLATKPGFNSPRPYIYNIVYELRDGRWFAPGCYSGPFLTTQINERTAETGLTVIELTGDDLESFIYPG